MFLLSDGESITVFTKARHVIFIDFLEVFHEKIDFRLIFLRGYSQKFPSQQQERLSASSLTTAHVYVCVCVKALEMSCYRNKITLRKSIKFSILLLSFFFRYHPSFFPFFSSVVVVFWWRLRKGKKEKKRRRKSGKTVCAERKT